MFYLQTVNAPDPEFRFPEEFFATCPSMRCTPAGGHGKICAVQSSTADVELYNLKDDIGEKNNLAAKHPEKLKELAAQWDKWNADNIDPAWGPKVKAGAGPGKKKNKIKLCRPARQRFLLLRSRHFLAAASATRVRHWG